jgi:hypothetical protein
MWCVWFLRIARANETKEMIYDFVKIIKQSAAFWLHTRKGRMRKKRASYFILHLSMCYEVVCRFTICCSRHHLNINFFFLHAFRFQVSSFLRFCEFFWFTQQFKIPEKPQLAGVSNNNTSLYISLSHSIAFYLFFIVVVIIMTLFKQDTAGKKAVLVQCLRNLIECMFLAFILSFNSSWVFGTGSLLLLNFVSNNHIFFNSFAPSYGKQRLKMF